MATLFRIEIRNPNGALLGILKDAFNITLEESINAPKILSFTIPATDFRCPYVLKANEFWVRDMTADTVIAKTKLLRQEDTDGY